MTKPLPLLALTNVFKRLNQNDLLSCKLVCREWKATIDSFEFDTLLIHDFVCVQNRKWPFPLDGALGYRNSLQVPLSKKVKANFLERHFKRCKRLYIESKRDYLAELSIFKELELLVADFPTDESALRLRKLKFLSLNWPAKGLTLDLPELETLLCWKYIETINLSRPLRLTHLQCDEMPLNVKQFRSLRYLVTKHSNWIDPDFLEHLPALRELRIYPKSLRDLNYLQMRVHGEKQRLGRDDLRIYMTGLEEVSVLVNFGLSSKNFLNLNERNMDEVCRNYYQLAGNIPFPFIVNYTSLIEHFVRVPDDFQAKFLNIVEVIVSQLDGQNEEAIQSFVSFLNACQTVHTLKIRDAQLSEPFYKQLSNCPSISNLIIAETNLQIDNFDFLLAIPNLRNLILHSLSLPVGLIEVMLKCVQFRKLFFKFPEQSENGRALPISWKLKIIARHYRNAAFKVKIDGKDSFCKNIERVKALLRKKLPFFVE